MSTASGTYETTERSNICVREVSEMMAGNVSWLTKDINLYIIEAQQIPKGYMQIYSHIIYNHHISYIIIIIKWLETKGKEEISKAAREHLNDSRFLSINHRDQRRHHSIVRVLEEKNCPLKFYIQ